MKPKQERRLGDKKPLDQTEAQGRTEAADTPGGPTPEEKEQLKRQSHADLSNDRIRDRSSIEENF